MLVGGDGGLHRFSMMASGAYWPIKTYLQCFVCCILNSTYAEWSNNSTLLIVKI